MYNMKTYAEKVAKEHGVQGVIAGTLKPARRFKKDKEVPNCTSYEIPEETTQLTYGATVEETDCMDACERDMELLNEGLKKEGIITSEGMAAGTNIRNDATSMHVDTGGSQQTIVVVAEDGALDNEVS
jgi:hypothetical protein